MHRLLSVSVAVFLVFTVFLAILTGISAHRFLETTDDYSASLNIAGRQRFLAASMVSHSAEVARGAEGAPQRLALTIERFEDGIRRLSLDDRITTTTQNPVSASDALAQQQRLWHGIRSDLQAQLEHGARPPEGLHVRLEALASRANDLVTILQTEADTDWRDARFGLAALGFVDLGLLIWGALLAVRLIRRERELARDSAATSERMRHLLESNPAIVYRLQLHPAPVFNFVSPNIEQQLGYLPAHLIDSESAFRAMVHDEDAARLLEVYNCLTEGASTEVTYRMRHRDGTFRSMRDEVRLVEFSDGREVVGTAVDVSERLAAELERDRFFSLSLDMLCVADFHGRFKRVNPAWSDLLDCSEQEILETPLVDFVHPDDRQQTLEEMGRLRDGHMTLHFENRFRAQDGSYRWLMWTASPDMERQLIYATARDITQMKNAQEELTRARRVAEQADKAKSQFLANMSHELRTPMNAIIGFSEVLHDARFGPLNDKQTRYVDNILTSGRHLLELINDILDLSKVEAGKMELEAEPVDMGAETENVISLVRGLALKKKIQLTTDIDEALPTIEADRARFKQILYNLLSNAIKFTPDEGQVSVAVSMEGDGQALRVSVSDTGVGIDAEDVERVFGVFEQVNGSYSRQQQGTGLGLALTRQLVELHGGRIWAESEGENHGSTFHITFPVSIETEQPNDPAPSPAPAVEHPDQPADGERPIVLVVEDEDGAAELLQHHLQQEGYGVERVARGDLVLQRARSLQPVAITLDILLPGRHGLDVLDELKRDPSTADIPVVIVSMTEDKKLGLSLGAAAFLTKPVNPRQLIAATRNAISSAPGGQVLVIDDEAAVRASITGALDAGGFEVVEASGGRQGIELAQKLQPAVVIVELMMRDLSGFEVVNSLRSREATKDIPVVVYTDQTLSPEQHQRISGQVQRIVDRSAEGEQGFLQELRHVVASTREAVHA